MKLSLTVSIVLAVYFQSIANPFSRFDDPFILEFYGINNAISFLKVITPGSGFYYRPLVNLSFWLDFHLWGLAPTFMHLENIVAHLINVLLVFLIASRLPVSSEIKSLPFLCALLFGLHPINSESVNWIAGRTDLFAGIFILLAIYCLIRAVQEQSSRLAILAFVVAFVGTLAKETAFMFIPAALLVAVYWPVIPQDVSLCRTWRKRFLLLPIIISTCLISSLLTLVYVKRPGNNSAISMIIEGGTNTFVRIFEAFGFYVKKIFLPFPLNVAIVEVNPFYILVGIIALIVLVATIRRSGTLGIFLAAAALFTLPALFVAASPIAWTPYGERYLYIPSAFAVIGCLQICHRSLERWNAVKWFVPIVSTIIVVSSIVTIQRGMLWGDNLALIEDTIAKSPNFGVVRNEYGVLLKEAGRFNEAEDQFKIALQQENKENVNRIIRLNLIAMKIRGKRPAEARQILVSEIGDKATGDVELLKLLNRYDEYFLGQAMSIDDRRKIAGDIVETNEILYQKTREPHYFYRSGQIALSVGNKEDAAVYFRKAYEYALTDAYYREPARKLAEELGAK